MAIFGCYSNLSRQHLLFNEQGFQTYYKENKLDQKLRPFSAVIPMWRDKTSSSTSRDSIGTKSKTVSGNSYKTLSAMQRCNQKLWAFSAVVPVWRDKTSSSTSRDSRGNTRKTASGNYCKTLSAINGQIKSWGPFQLLFRSSASRPPFQQVRIT
jgi:hypothetical protein